MKPSFWHRVDRFARDLTPFALTFLLLVINVIPFHIPGFAQVAPFVAAYRDLFLDNISTRPDARRRGLSDWHLARFSVGPSDWGQCAYLSGCFGCCLGATLVFLWKIVRHRVAWVYGGCGGALTLEWVLLSILAGDLMQVRSAVYQFGLTAAMFPVLAWLFTRWQQAFLQVD